VVGLTTNSQVQQQLQNNASPADLRRQPTPCPERKE